MAANIGYTEQTGTTTTAKPSWYDDLYKNLLQQGQGLIGQGTGYYGGPLSAGFTPEQYQAGQLLQQNLGNWNQPFQQGMGTTQGALGQIQQASQYNPAQMQQFLNPYIGGVVDEIARQGNMNLTQNILPGIADQYTSLGQFGSGRQGNALAQASALAQREILGQQSQALMGAYNQAGNQYQNWGQLGVQGGQAMGNLGQQQLQAAQQLQNQANVEQQQLFGYGEKAQQTQQNANTANYQEWLRQQQQQMTNLGMYGKLFGAGSPSETVTASQSGTQSQFKKGGLAYFADGGEVDDEDISTVDTDIPARLLNYSVNPGIQKRLIPPLMGEAAANLMQGRGLYSEIASSPHFAPLPERTAVGQLGESMLRAAAAGPGQLGELVGRTGTNYYNIDLAREAENKSRAKEKLSLLSTLNKYQTADVMNLLGKLAKDPNARLSKIGQMLIEMGYEPGTPEFNTKMNELLDQQRSADLSTAGKIARDEGLKVGTPEFNKRVNELVKFDQGIKERGAETRESTAETYKGNLGERQKETGAKYGPLTPSGQVAPASGTVPGEAILPKGEFTGNETAIRKDIARIPDPVERKAASDAYDRQLAGVQAEKTATYQNHPGVLYYTRQGLPVKSAIEQFDKNQKEYDKYSEEQSKNAPRLTGTDLDAAYQLNEDIHNKFGIKTGPWFNYADPQWAASLAGENGKKIAQLESFGTEMVPQLTKGLSPVSDADMRTMSKAGFGPKVDYEVNKQNISRAKFALNLVKEHDTFMEAAREMGLPITKAKVYWNKYINKNPMFDSKKTKDKGLLAFAGDPTKRAEILDEHIEDMRREFFGGGGTSRKPAGNRIIVSPEDLR